MEIGTFYINGEFVTPKGTEKIALINPATEEEIGFVVAGNEEDVDLAAAMASFTAKYATAPRNKGGSPTAFDECTAYGFLEFSRRVTFIK